MTKTAPYGSWKSPITSDLIASGAIRLEQVMLDGEDVYWIEMRPAEGGRYVIVRRSPDGVARDVTPPPFNARTRVHEYGGGSFVAFGGAVYFSNFEDQRLYRLDEGDLPRPITPAGNVRYADLIVDRGRERIVCVSEDHSAEGQEPENSLVSIDLHDGVHDCVHEGSIRKLVTGSDFYSSPRLSPDGSRLAWLSWDHPNMPWDGTELWVGELDSDGSLLGSEKVAGGVRESVFQPEWSPDSVLHFVSDRTGWWNLYRWIDDDDLAEPLTRMEAEFGRPQWAFGMSTYGFESKDRIICSYTQKGVWYLASLDATTPTPDIERIETPYTEISYLRAAPGQAVFVGGSPTEPNSIVRLDTSSGKTEVMRRSSEVAIDPGHLSAPRQIDFATAKGLLAHALYYPPKNRDYVAPPEERPPLLVMSHGGPTGSASGALNLSIQYWTSRGISVLDVNYGGSSGYGREYRERLEGRWGVVDVDDCVNGARYLAGRGKADPDRLMIRGGSAGGYTTLSALTFRDVFKAGASYYGISDLETLARETHKFESRYLDGLVGPYPERQDLYKERSPINFVDRLSCPVIFFQGLEDKVVPPDQAEAMFEALCAKGLPVAYVTFEKEQHGFRRAENIKRSLDAELYFYSRVFCFDLADEVEPVPIENL